MTDREKTLLAGIAILLVLLLLGFKWLIPGSGISGGGDTEPYQPTLQIPNVDLGDGPNLPDAYVPTIPDRRRPTCGCIRNSGNVDYGYDRPTDWLTDPEIYTPRKPDVKIPLLQPTAKKDYMVKSSTTGDRVFVSIYPMSVTEVEYQGSFALDKRQASGTPVWAGYVPIRDAPPPGMYNLATRTMVNPNGQPLGVSPISAHSLAIRAGLGTNVRYLQVPFNIGMYAA